MKGVAMTRLLLDHGAMVNVVDHGILKQTPLHHFAMLGDLESVKLLLEHGAYRDALNGSGETPLDEAAFWGHDKVVEFLLQGGAKPSEYTLNQATSSNDAKVIRLIRSHLHPETIHPPHRR
jgi:ankyrin repeat protein